MGANKMKKARVAFGGSIHEAIDWEGGLKLDDGRIVKVNEVTWLPPILPRTVFALGLNYADHAAELAFDAPGASNARLAANNLHN